MKSEEGGAGRRHQRHQGRGGRGDRARAAGWRCCACIERSRAKRRMRGRREDRHSDPEAGARGAGPPDRGELRRRRRRGRCAHAGEPGQLRLRCGAQGVCRPGRGRHHRSDQGGAHRAGERGFGGERAAADRGDDDGDPGGEEGAGELSRRWQCDLRRLHVASR